MRDLLGPPGAPVVVLLHGLGATADLNWFPSYRPLSAHYRVIAIDHRGHGGGKRSHRVFRLEDCADDVVELADALGVQTFIPVGYSMGGPIAQLVWKRHRSRVDGLVLCATAARFASGGDQRIGSMSLGGLAMASRLTPPAMRRRFVNEMVSRRDATGPEQWAREQVRRHDLTAVLEAGRAVGRFSSTEWIGSVDVPTAVVVTTRDTLGLATPSDGVGFGDRRSDGAPGRRRSRCCGLRCRPLRSRAARRVRVGGLARCCSRPSDQKRDALIHVRP